MARYLDQHLVDLLRPLQLSFDTKLLHIIAWMCTIGRKKIA